VVKSRLDAPVARPDAPISVRALVHVPRPRHDRTRRSPRLPNVRSLTVSIQSRFFHDLTRPIAHDRTHDRVRSSLPQLPAPRQRTSPMTGRTSITLGHFLHQRPVTDQHCALHCRANRTRRSRIRSCVQSILVTSSTSQTLPPFIKCANHQVFHLVHVC
jgi:hypothetical protein